MAVASDSDSGKPLVLNVLFVLFPCVHHRGVPLQLPVVGSVSACRQDTSIPMKQQPILEAKSVRPTSPVPPTAMFTHRYLLSVVCTVSIGRIGPPELAASSLANSVYVVTGLSLVMGLSSAMETLCGQV